MRSGTLTTIMETRGYKGWGRNGELNASWVLAGISPIKKSSVLQSLQLNVEGTK